MKAPLPRWVETVSYAVVGTIIAGAVATVWECAGLFAHGVVRFGLVSLFFSGVAYVLHNKPKVSQ